MSDTAQCPFCKSTNTDTPLTINGYWWCDDCRRPFMPFTVGATDWVSVMVSDLEEKYISRQSFDALHTRLTAAEQRAEAAEQQVRKIEQELWGEQKAHQLIASICSSVGVDTSDGTSVSAVRNLAKEVREMREAMRWVPVSEDIPAEGASVQVIANGKYYPVGFWYWEMGDHDEQYRQWECHDPDWLQMVPLPEPPTHWRNLPEPPKDGEG